jgi:hypothetical protein
VSGLRTASTGERAGWAVLLALLLALRLLFPAGFMPAFDHGEVMIVACPDAGPTASPTAHHHHYHHGDRKKAHSPCPYAAAPALGFAGDDVILPAAVLAIGLALLLGRASTFVEKARRFRLPPLRGPPLPA